MKATKPKKNVVQICERSSAMQQGGDAEDGCEWDELELLLTTRVASWLDTPQSEEESSEDEGIDAGSDVYTTEPWTFRRLIREKPATANEPTM
ncbi:hypothetical protein L1987_37366 [Smallanthus sonchifolius]|uniref:Uncharacterized protein n=1 Tax=Smallanthus sonchifolius TaxID=185202 RepID=A0ACB9HG60_9ASTR|nr:hypothetical protein L1987_37366 [Smallanthus sonchifolius]